MKKKKHIVNQKYIEYLKFKIIIVMLYFTIKLFHIFLHSNSNSLFLCHILNFMKLYIRNDIINRFKITLCYIILYYIILK